MGTKSNSSKLAKQTIPDGAGVRVPAGNANLGGYMVVVSAYQARKATWSADTRGTSAKIITCVLSVLCI